MTTTPHPRSIAALDVSAQQVASDMAALVARQRREAALALWNATPERFQELAAHPVRADAGHLDEYRHLLHDEDPDSTAPAIRVNLTKHQARRPS